MHRVLFLAGLVCLALPSVMAQEKPLVNKAATLKFATNPSVPPCVSSAVERGVPSKGPFLILGRYTPGCAFPWHSHTANEEVFIVSGTVKFEAKGSSPSVLRAGDYYFVPARHIHRAACTGRAPCMFFLSRDGANDFHYVNAAGQEIPPDEALKGTKKAAQPAKRPQ